MLQINCLRLAFKFREKAFKLANSGTISVTEKQGILEEENQDVNQKKRMVSTNPQILKDITTYEQLMQFPHLKIYTSYQSTLIKIL